MPLPDTSMTLLEHAGSPLLDIGGNFGLLTVVHPAKGQQAAIEFVVTDQDRATRATPIGFLHLCFQTPPEIVGIRTEPQPT